MLHDANLKLFSPASPHYERAAETSTEIMARYKAAFDAARIAPARWNVGGQISPAYGMPKFKSFKDGYDDSPPARQAGGYDDPPARQAGARAEPGCHCGVAGKSKICPRFADHVQRTPPWSSERVLPPKLKMRPIAAGHSDPMRGSKNACARAIMFMLDRCEQRGTVDNMRMISCTALTNTLRAGNQQLRNANNFPANSDGTAVDVSKLRLKLVVHDVAQLYTSLPHDVVREALAWLTSTYKKTVRQKQAFIAVPIRGRQAKSQIHGGRSQNEATATTWSLESITALVDLSLEFSYLQLGVDHPLRRL